MTLSEYLLRVRDHFASGKTIDDPVDLMMGLAPGRFELFEQGMDLLDQCTPESSRIFAIYIQGGRAHMDEQERVDFIYGHDVKPNEVAGVIGKAAMMARQMEEEGTLDTWWAQRNLGMSSGDVERAIQEARR